jgi:3-oxoacyl-[acyl-carrier protein] reductase
MSARLSYLDRLRLDGRVALVVGAGGGRMGSECAIALADAGALVAGIDMDAERMGDVDRQITSGGGTFLPLVADVTDAGAVEAAVETAWAELGPVQHLVHVVGGNVPEQYWGQAPDPATRFAAAVAVSEDRLSSILDFNILTTFRTCGAVARRLIDTGRDGTIVTFSSVVGMNGAPGYSAYSAAKAAVISLTRTYAVEWGRYGIRVNSVAPGQTGSGKPRPNAVDLDTDYLNLELCPLGRAAEIADIAGVVLFLSSALSGVLTGQTLIVDSGATARSQIVPTGGPVRAPA